MDKPGRNSTLIRVLVVATTFPRWKNDREPRFVFDLSRHLAKNIEVWALVPHAPGAQTREEMDGVHIIRFPYFLPGKRQTLCYEGGILPKLRKGGQALFQLPFFLAAQLFSMWQTLRRYPIDLIHCHWIIPQGFFAGLLGSWGRIPCLLTAHGSDVLGFKGNRLISWIQKFALKRAQVCTVNSQATREAVLRLHPHSKVRVIPMGVDTQLFHPNKFNAALKEKLDIHGLFLLGVGRLAETKGFEALIRALPAILRTHPGSKLILIGTGPQEKSLRKLVQYLNLESSALLPGAKTAEELAEYLATADILIHPAQIDSSGASEGQGLVLLEAMASGTPVIASDVGGVKDIVQDGKTGLLVAQKQPEAIAEKVLLLAEQEKLREELSRNGRTLAQTRYSWEAVAQTFLQTYCETLRKTT